METKVATSIARGGTREATQTLIRELTEKLGGEKPQLIGAFASTSQPLAEVVRALSEAFPGATLVGASTAGEFVAAGDEKGAVSAFAISGNFRAFAGMGTGLKSDPEAAVSSAVEGLPQSVFGFPHRTALLLIDAFAGHGEEVTLMAAARLGMDQPLAGGAAGDDLRMKSTNVACGSRASSDALVVAQIFTREPLGIGVCHGHQPLSKPLAVTKARGNVVQEIEGRPAFDVWRDVTRERAKERGVDVDNLSADDEGGFLLRYEAGLSSGNEFKIRAPLSRDPAGAITFATGIPEGAVIRIMDGEPARQIDSAREAARRARTALGSRKVSGAVVFDCICRKLILGDEFKHAVGSISEELGGAPICGFETYGEIALAVGEMSGFHNTTSVVLAFPA